MIGITAFFWVLPQNDNLGYTVMSVSAKQEFVCTAKPSSHPHSQWRPSCCWSSSERPHRLPPEVGDNINTAEMGNLGLNHGEELAIVAFLEILSDGYMHKK